MTATSPSAAAHAAAHKLFSFRRTSAIAGNTFRDLVRQKVFYFMLVFALILIGASLILVPLSFRGQLQTVMDVSLGAMSIFTMLLAVLSTAVLLPRDVEERTLYTILAKPVARFEYLVGKLAGVGIMLFIATLLMTAVFSLVLYYWQQREIANIELHVEVEKVQYVIGQLKSGTFTGTLYGGIGVILLRAIVCAALTLMVSTFASSWLFTVVVAFMMILIGHLVPIARSIWINPMSVGLEQVPWYLNGFLRLVGVFCPDMQLFNIVDDIAVGTVVAPSLFLTVLGLGFGYLAIYVLVAWLFFAWKEL
jgi:ABC-type transport system involved in multi-copper enzyme maturation permease subunit